MKFLWNRQSILWQRGLDSTFREGYIMKRILCFLAIATICLASTAWGMQDFPGHPIGERREMKVSGGGEHTIEVANLDYVDYVLEVDNSGRKIRVRYKSSGSPANSVANPGDVIAIAALDGKWTISGDNGEKIEFEVGGGAGKSTTRIDLSPRGNPRSAVIAIAAVVRGGEDGMIMKLKHRDKKSQWPSGVYVNLGGSNNNKKDKSSGASAESKAKKLKRVGSSKD